MTFVLGLRPDVDFEALVATLTVNALRIRPAGDGRVALGQAAVRLRDRT